MSRYHGFKTDDDGRRTSGRGWSREMRAEKRREAELRNALTPLERTAKFRRDRAVVQAAVAEARAQRDAA